MRLFRRSRGNRGNSGSLRGVEFVVSSSEVRVDFLGPFFCGHLRQFHDSKFDEIGVKAGVVLGYCLFLI